MFKNWLNQEIKGFSTNEEKWKFIAITVVLAFIFIHVFEPFGVYGITASSTLDTFIELTLAIVMAGLVLIFSQFILRKWLLKSTVTILQMIFWFLLDVFLIGSFWTLLESGAENEINASVYLWIQYVLGACFLLMLPYFAAIFILDYFERQKEHKQLLDAQTIETQTPELIHFKDEKEIERLSIKKENLLYIQSSDNYVAIFYIENDKVVQYLLRNSIKKLERDLAPHSIIRCHRSYMVNVSNVISKKRKGSKLILKVKFIPELDLPVSKAYHSEIEKTVGSAAATCRF